VAVAAAAPRLTRRELAEAMGVVMMTITKWEARGMPVLERGRPGKPSYYDLEACEAWKAAVEEQAQASGTVDVAKERALRERAQAALANQTYQMRSGELLPRAEVERQWEAEILAVRTKLLQIAPLFAERVYQAALTDGIPGVERLLGDCVDEVLRELSGVQDGAIA
jgi:phage terminase Nu1 subunit (DNA packaging protein)